MRYPRLYNALLQFIYSTFIFGLLFYPIGLIHETGHALICISQNGVFPWDWFFRLSVICDPLPMPKELSFAMGGFFGMMASLIPILTIKTIRKNNLLLGGFVGSTVFQFLYFLAETWAHYDYMGNEPSLFGVITFIVLLSIFYFSRNKGIKNSPN